ncbi:MAG: hypothetical protein AB7I50_05120 [Vicinamibacterales bacterium]
MSTRRYLVIAGCVAAVLSGSGAFAQDEPSPGVPVEGQAEVRVIRSSAGVQGDTMMWVGAGPAVADFDVISGPVSFDRSLVKDAPYSAEAVTEFVQTLSDGNRIVRRSSVSVYRDSVGRTRREQGLTAIGSLVNNPEVARQISISDPQRGVSIVLDMTNRVARRLTIPKIEFAPGSTAELKRPTPGMSAGGSDMVFSAPPLPEGVGAVGTLAFRTSRAELSPPHTESLGTRVMDGVSAEGTRTTIIIPAGQIGNERPIEIVNERWFSPELRVLMASRQVDPRFGETTYRLSEVVLGEPAASLFDVPSDFKVVDDGPSAVRVIRQGERRAIP